MLHGFGLFWDRTEPAGRLWWWGWQVLHCFPVVSYYLIHYCPGSWMKLRCALFVSWNFAGVFWGSCTCGDPFSTFFHIYHRCHKADCNLMLRAARGKKTWTVYDSFCFLLLVLLLSCRRKLQSMCVARTQSSRGKLCVLSTMPTVTKPQLMLMFSLDQLQSQRSTDWTARTWTSKSRWFQQRTL